MRSETLALHAGHAPRVIGVPLDPPLVPASSFHAAGCAREDGSPGWTPLEAAMGALDGGAAVEIVGCEHVEDPWDDLEQAL